MSRFVIPGTITQNMIGFNRNGQTKVWVNENFGMNHPANQSLEVTLDEAHVLDSLVSAVSPKLDLTPDFFNGVRNSRTFLNALNFVKGNAGVPENVLEANRVNVAGLGQQSSTILNSNVQVQHNVTPTFVPQTSNFVASHVPAYQPPVQTVHTGYVNPKVHFAHNYGTQAANLAFQPRNVQPVSTYQPVQTQNKFSFTSPQ